jgi:hypothetical protein
VGLDAILPLFLIFVIVLVVVLGLVMAALWLVSQLRVAFRSPPGRHRPPEREKRL